jgi:hypothetical protein
MAWMDTRYSSGRKQSRCSGSAHRPRKPSWPRRRAYAVVATRPPKYASRNVIPGLGGRIAGSPAWADFGHGRQQRVPHPEFQQVHDAASPEPPARPGLDQRSPVFPRSMPKAQRYRCRHSCPVRHGAFVQTTASGSWTTGQHARRTAVDRSVASARVSSGTPPTAVGASRQASTRRRRTTSALG